MKSTEHGSCAISMLRIGEFGQGDGLSRSYRIRSKGVGVGSCVHGQCYFPPTAAACLIISTAGNTTGFSPVFHDTGTAHGSSGRVDGRNVSMCLVGTMITLLNKQCHDS